MNAKLFDNPQQKLICVDSKGRETGKIVDRKTAHSSPGTKHLAIQVLLFNSKKELILHERPVKKVGGGVLDAPTTHILHGETEEEAAHRCLKDEYGITEKIPVIVLGGFSYEKDYGDGTCENEFCLAAFAAFGGKISHSSEHALKIVNEPAKKVALEIGNGSGQYPIWLKETVKIVSGSKDGKKFFA